MKERDGVRLGLAVRDLDGVSLGRVVRLFDWGFQTRRGLLLWKREHLVRYDEVRGLRDGGLVVARSRRDLFELAAGGIPPAWRIRAPAAFPVAATPAEARELIAAIARGDVPGATEEEPTLAPAATEVGPGAGPAPGLEEAPRVRRGAAGQGAAPPHR